MISAVIFDLDGVLVDATEWHYEALNVSLSEVGSYIELHEHLTEFDGLPTRTKLEMLSAKGRLDRNLHRSVEMRKQELTLRVFEERVIPQTEQQELMEFLSQKGLRLGLASNSVRSTVDLVLEKADLGRWISVSLSSSDVENPKPSPDIYLECALRLGVKPESCIVVEDNQKGVDAALNADMFVLKVKSPIFVTKESIGLAIANANAGQKLTEVD